MESINTRTLPDKGIIRRIQRDAMNNELSSTSSDDGIAPATNNVNNNKFYKHTPYNTAASDNEAVRNAKNKASKLQSRNHFKSMGNINDNEFIRESDYNTNINRVQNSVSNVDVSLRSELGKYESLQIPIVGYEVMEERARFTVYKLKVDDEKTNQCWLVFRRYTDFVRLYSRVKLENPSLMLPLPGKRWFKDNFEPAFLEDRVRGLQIFVDAILKVLSSHPLVREFFCLDEPPQVFSYQPEVQAVYGALEDSISNLKIQLKQKDSTIIHLQKRLALLEGQLKNCPACSTNI